MTKLLKILITLWFVRDNNALKWGDEAVRSAGKLSNNVNEILDDLLGHKNLQDFYNTLSFTQRKLDGKDILDKMAIGFGQKFFDRNKAIEHLQTIVQDSLTSTKVLSECCRLSTNQLEMDDRFKQPIGTAACYRKSKLTKQEFGFLSEKFEKACSDNLARMPSLRWQYFASESGITTLYPAIAVDDCGSYDPRFRPFYVQTNVPEAKDVVIVIDKSGSMGQRVTISTTLMDIAKGAAKTVISTLNPHDRVAVIGFSTTVVSMGSNPKQACFRDHLAVATTDNVDSMDQFVDGISDGGQTYYGNALSKAFDYLENSASDNNRDRVILFLSDGVPTDEGPSIFKILKERNSKLNNSVILMTYGLGSANFTILRDMAAQDGSAYGVAKDHQAESTKAGLFTQVDDPKDLRLEMASYYTFFSKRASSSSKSEPIWSLPYLDKWGLGLLMSVTLPINNDAGDVIGVVGTDLTLDDLLSAAVYFRPSELSYTFIIDRSGFVIYHPLFKYPEDHEVRYTDILAFETDPGMIEVITDMKNGGSGSKTFRSQRVRPGGSSKLYGVKTFTLSTVAYWKQIPHSEFSLCVVLTEDDHESTLQYLGPRSGEEFLYHRIDLVPPQTPCKHYNNYCAMNQTVVSLGPRAFTDTDGYLYNKETASSVSSLTKYMVTGRGGYSVKEGIRNSVWATQEAERYWKRNSDSELEKYVMWKYVGTKEGMIRIYPGAQFPKDFDSTVRPWYRNSIANKESITFTLPYKDAVSGEYVVTLTKVIYEGINGIRNHLEDEVVAVMAVDMLVPFFESMLKDNFPICFEENDFGNTQVYSHRCVLIDSAGFLMHANYAIDRNSVIPEHITQKEPLIAENLIALNIMRRSSCIVMEETYLQRTYEIHETQHFSAKVSGNCFEYQFIPILGTNIYMIIREIKSKCASNPVSCLCSNFFSTSRSCLAGPYSCECPCTKLYENYDTCSNKYEFSREEVVPKSCVPEPKPLMKIGENENNIDDLSACSKYSFNVKKSTTTTTPYYTTTTTKTSTTTNYYTTTTKYPSDTDTNKGSEGVNIVAIVLGCVFGLIAIVAIIVIAWKCANKQAITNKHQPPAYAPPSTAPMHTNPNPTAPPAYRESIYMNSMSLPQSY